MCVNKEMIVICVHRRGFEFDVHMSYSDIHFLNVLQLLNDVSCSFNVALELFINLLVLIVIIAILFNVCIALKSIASIWSLMSDALDIVSFLKAGPRKIELVNGSTRYNEAKDLP